MLLLPHGEVTEHDSIYKGKGDKESILIISSWCATQTDQEVTWTCGQHACGHLSFLSPSVWYFVSS